MSDDSWTVEDEIESTLKPCVRCGSKATLEDGGIHCSECGWWTGEDMDLNEAISWWNEQPYLDTLHARIAELTAQLAEANRWVPKIDYQTGVLSTLIETANAPGEEIWDEILKDDAPRPTKGEGDANS